MGLFSKKKKNVNVDAKKKKTFTIDDIKDDDMMVAALVATIDYADKKNANVRLVSIKQIS